MLKNTGWKGLALLLCAIGLLTACGQKGDLYLPEGRLLTIMMA